MKIDYKGYNIWTQFSMNDRGIIFGYIEKDGVRARIIRKANKWNFVSETTYSSIFGRDTTRREEEGFDEKESAYDLFEELKNIVDAIDLFSKEKVIYKYIESPIIPLEVEE